MIKHGEGGYNDIQSSTVCLVLLEDIIRSELR